MKLTGKNLEQRLKDDFIEFRSCGHIPTRDEYFQDLIEDGDEVDKAEYEKICNDLYLF